MNRFGCIMLLLFAAAATAFVFLVRPGGNAPVMETPAAKPEAVKIGDLVLPVAGVVPAQLTDTWGQARANGAREHHAIDIMSPRGTPVVAAASGKIEKLFESGDGGHTIYIRSSDGRIIYYYAHLDAYRAGLAEGQAVKAGDVLATVGSTGNASPDAPHLHFEIKRMAQGEGWWQGQEVNPYPLLAGQAAAR